MIVIIPALALTITFAFVIAARKSGASTKQAAAAMFVCYWLAIQLYLPIREMGQSTQTRFGWSMFAHKRNFPSFSVEDQNGNIGRRITVKQIGWVRYDIDFENLAPPYLCGANTGARAVHRYSRSAHTRIPCSTDSTKK